MLLYRVVVLPMRLHFRFGVILFLSLFVIFEQASSSREIPYSEKKAFCYDESSALMAISMYAFQKEFNECMENAEQRIEEHEEAMKESFRHLGEMMKQQQLEDARKRRIQQEKYEEEERQKEALFDKFR